MQTSPGVLRHLRLLVLALALLLVGGYLTTAPRLLPTASAQADDDDGSGDDDDGVPDNDDDDDDNAAPAPGRSTGRLAGPDRFATSVAISQFEFPNGSDVVYLARADAFADALSGGSLTRGPILLVPACGELPAAVAAEIARLAPSQVIALGGEQAICQSLLDAAAAA